MTWTIPLAVAGLAAGTTLMFADPPAGSPEKVSPALLEEQYETRFAILKRRTELKHAVLVRLIAGEIGFPAAVEACEVIDHDWPVGSCEPSVIYPPHLPPGVWAAGVVFEEVDYLTRDAPDRAAVLDRLRAEQAAFVRDRSAAAH